MRLSHSPAFNYLRFGGAALLKDTSDRSGSELLGYSSNSIVTHVLPKLLHVLTTV